MLGAFAHLGLLCTAFPRRIPQTPNLRPKQARLLRFKFCIRDIKKMKAQICAENGSNLKSNLTAEQKNGQSNLSEKA